MWGLQKADGCEGLEGAREPSGLGAKVERSYLVDLELLKLLQLPLEAQVGALSIIAFRSIHVVANGKLSFFVMAK